MSQNKTQPTQDSVDDFLKAVLPESKQKDCLILKNLMEKITNEPAVLWGTIVGFGQYNYQYNSGRSGTFFKIGFAPRAKNISIYAAAYDDDLDQKKRALGKVKLGKSCIYINQLKDVNLEILEEILSQSIAIVDKRWPAKQS